MRERCPGGQAKRRRFARVAAARSVLLAWAVALFSATILCAQDGTQAYVVRLREDAVIEHLRRLPAILSLRMNLQDDEAVRYRSQLLGRQGSIRRRIEAVSRAEIREQMDTVFNGFAVRMRPEDVAAVATLPEVAAVFPSVLYHKVLDAATPLVQVPAAWSDPRIRGEDNAGAGVKIGVIDTGIDINHLMLQDPALTPPAGYPLFTAPTLSCPNSDLLFTNSKVIVARNYVPLLKFPDLNCDAMDRNGHGTFVSGIAAGRRVQAPLASIAGVAPKAFLGSYKVFGTPGVNDNATSGAILKAIDDATKDGMDIINISLGAEIPLPPSLDPLAQAAAAAVSAGVTVVVAAGNFGPASGTITSPGTSPAVITVGTTSNSRLLATQLLVSGTLAVPLELQMIATANSNGPVIDSDIGPAQFTDVISVDSSGSACGVLPFASLSQRMVLIRRGGCSFETKILNAALAGAAAVVIYNNLSQQPAVRMNVLTAKQIPSVMIGNAEGTTLASYLAAAGAGATGTLAAKLQATAPNQMTDFSAAGPSSDFGIKPDLVAPGENIYSSEQRNFPAGEQFSATGFGINSGTSFSSPMVAGAAALVKQASPGFTPAQIKSALVQTASKSVTPFAGGVSGVLAFGNGLMDVAAALATPATVSPVSITFGTNSPGSILNQSVSLSVQNVSGVTDSFTLSQQASAGSAPVVLTPTPASFTLGPGATTVVSILSTSSQPITGTVEGFLTLRSQNIGRTLTIPYWGNFLLPRISNNGVVNTASLTAGPGRVAPGSLISIFGVQMTPGVTAAASSIPLPTSLAGIRVLFSGIEEPAPLLYVSPTQITAQVPQGLAGSTVTTLQVVFNGVASASALVTLAATGPGIFAVNQAGTGRGAVLHAANHREVTSRNPAKPGEILEVFVNGLGPTSPSVATGQAASSNPRSVVLVPPTATLGAVAAPVQAATLLPSFVGIYQVNIEVPADAPAGEIPLFLISNGVPSNPVTVSIGR
ncbi:MAG: S8 family serine peptidase [Acidobacteria bacterium]|nr:S8 family serine peptidase [Acidobacteriota bacterium]